MIERSVWDRGNSVWQASADLASVPEPGMFRLTKVRQYFPTRMDRVRGTVVQLLVLVREAIDDHVPEAEDSESKKTVVNWR